ARIFSFHARDFLLVLLLVIVIDLLTCRSRARDENSEEQFEIRGSFGKLKASQKRGRTGFDSLFETQAACRGWFVGLVKNRTKTNKRRSPRSRSRGLIDRDVWSWTRATAPNVDSMLVGRRSDRAGR